MAGIIQDVGAFLTGWNPGFQFLADDYHWKLNRDYYYCNSGIFCSALDQEYQGMVSSAGHWHDSGICSSCSSVSMEYHSLDP